MITFKLPKRKELFESFADLNELVYEANKNRYLGVMLGSYNDYALEKLGIIIDGTKERVLADDFEDVLKKKKIEYYREDAFGVIFYENRDY